MTSSGSIPGKCSVLIVGAGITGLTIARELISRGLKNIVLLEKEPFLGMHASGRNSGVLHAGIYYNPDTLKARYCVRGNQLMKEFCRAKGLTLIDSGKVVLGRTPAETEQLHELKRRADACGARAVLIDGKKLRELEPHAAPCDQALFSPDTATIRPLQVLEALKSEMEESGKGAIYCGAAFAGLSGEHEALTSKGRIRFEKLVNAAGSHGDRVAHKCGLAKEYRILPFKGTYKKLVHQRQSLVRGNIYPVPNLRTPFLGIHLTRTADNEILVGPTAIPACGRENYGLLDGLSGESFLILLRDSVLMFRNRDFRSVALSEPKKYFTHFVLNEARKLVPELSANDLTHTEHMGIRAQLVNWHTKKLVMDYVVLPHRDSIHVLNPISPAFTSSMAFAKDVVTGLLG